jgi:hypothetical protein
MGDLQPSPVRVKRRTLPDPRGPLTDAHRRAFDHARHVLKPTSLDCTRLSYRHAGRVIRFKVNLQTETRKNLTVTVECTRGFRIAFDLPWWNDSAVKAAHTFRHLPHRLAAYRERLNFHQQTTPDPLTFRSFNQLLIAISHDIITAND